MCVREVGVESRKSLLEMELIDTEVKQGKEQFYALS